MIIGLSGLKNSGKDTVAATLVKEYGYERRAYADPMKKSLAGTLGISFADIERWKNNSKVYVGVWEEDAEGDNLMQVFYTFREFMQRYPTEGHRDVPEIGDNFWVELTLPHSGYYPGRNIVITDVRFDNEASRVHALGGKIVEVERAALVNQDPHRSEAGITVEPDYTIFNNGTMEDLGMGVKIMLEHFEKQL